LRRPNCGGFQGLMLNQVKMAQMAAYLLQKRGGRMHLIKLMKLLYLSEREAIRRYGSVMAGDKVVSMDHGPVLSQTYNLANGATESIPDGWDYWISDRDAHEVSINQERQGFDLAQLDKLSPADTEILDRVWGQFGLMNRWDLCRWTHVNCAEWRDPQGSSFPIQMTEILRAVGYSDDQSKLLNAESDTQHKIDKIFASL